MTVVDFPSIDPTAARELLDEGVYKVRVKDYERCQATTGTKQIRFFAEVVEGKDKGKSVIDHVPLTDAASWKIASFIHHAGVDTKSLPKLDTDADSFTKVLENLKDREMYWYVIQDSWKGKPNNKVSEYKRLEDIEPDTIDLNADDVPEFLK